MPVLMAALLSDDDLAELKSAPKLADMITILDNLKGELREQGKLPKLVEKVPLRFVKGTEKLEVDLDSPRLSELVEWHQRIQLLDRQHSLLYETSLQTLVGMAELLFSQVVHSYFSNYPGALKDKEKVFSLSDLSKFDSVADARSYLIAAKVENLTRDSVRAWIEFIKETIKVKLSEPEFDLDRLEEIFKRRNLVVHNGGVVNTIYLNSIAPSLKANLRWEKSWRSLQSI